MKNILNIKVNSKSDCTCYENIDNGTNQILVRYERENPINPKIIVNEEEYALEFIDGVAIFALSFPDRSKEESSDYIYFKFVDDKYDGHEFVIDCTNWKGNFAFYTAKLVRVNTYSFRIDMVQIVDMSNVKIGDDLTINDDGELELKEVESITAMRDKTTDFVTFVGINYTDGSSSMNICSYNENGDLISFGGINIDWGDNSEQS